MCSKAKAKSRSASRCRRPSLQPTSPSSQAIGLLSLPREVAKHPETREPILAGIGRYGPYVQHGKTYANIGKDEDILEIGGNRAIDLIVAKESGLTGRRFGGSAERPVARARRASRGRARSRSRPGAMGLMSITARSTRPCRATPIPPH